jgi:hypothetical protein
MTALEAIVTGGVLLSSPQSLLGTATCTSALAVQPDTTSIGEMACLLDALKINLSIKSITFSKTNN